MNRISVLDVTLRDGGYCNNWTFGAANIINIENSLTEAGIEYIECGYLSSIAVNQEGRTIFQSVTDLEKLVLINKNKDTRYVVMINYGEASIESIPDYPGYGIVGIRVAFRKKHWEKALDFCCEIKKKGYLLFIQPMAVLSYSDSEYACLVNRVQEIQPYAFYIVDSFGSMRKNDLIRLFQKADKSLDEKIVLGFHAHNNMQMAFSNAQWFALESSLHDKIIDTSIMGMGRGAGNLNTELFLIYMNENFEAKYNLKPILYIIDAVLNNFYLVKRWGYSLPNYLSAKHNVHPKYAGYLCEKNTLSVDDMDEIFSSIPVEKKEEFDKPCIDNLYLKFMEKGQHTSERLEHMKAQLVGKNVLLIAPGTSSVTQKDRILAEAFKDSTVVVSVNHKYTFCKTDYVFCSNKKRYFELNLDKNDSIIATSNIPEADCYLQVEYGKLINDEDFVNDNAGLMAVKFFLLLGVKKIFLAGYDGFHHNIYENYADENMVLCIPENMAELINQGMKNVLKNYMKESEIVYITESCIF